MSLRTTADLAAAAPKANTQEMQPDDSWFDLFGASTPAPAPSPRITTDKTGPRSVRRDDASVAAADNKQARKSRKAVRR